MKQNSRPCLTTTLYGFLFCSGCKTDPYKGVIIQCHDCYSYIRVWTLEKLSHQKEVHVTERSMMYIESYFFSLIAGSWGISRGVAGSEPGDVGQDLLIKDL